MKKVLIYVSLFCIALLLANCTAPLPVVDFDFKAPVKAKAFELSTSGGPISGIELASNNILMVISNQGKMLVSKIEGLFEQGEGIFNSDLDFVVKETVTEEDYEDLVNARIMEREEGVFLGDFNLDGQVNLIDFTLFTDRYGSKAGEEKYNIQFDISPATDENGDGVYDTSIPDGLINGEDIVIFTHNYGKLPELDGPSFLFFSSQREGQYLADNVFGEVVGTSFSEGRYSMLSWLVDKPLAAMTIRFYRFDENGERYRMNMDVANKKWEVLPYGTPSSQQIPINWNINYDGLYGEYYFLPNNYITSFFLADGSTLLAENAFELGIVYGMWIDAYDIYGNSNFLYITFRLNERYSSENMPELFLEVNRINAAQVEVELKTRNVKEYLAQNEHGDEIDHTTTDGLMYLNIPIAFNPDLEIENIEFPQFLSTKKELNAYFIKNIPMESGWTETVVEISKGFVNGIPDSLVVGDALAKITFNIPVGFEDFLLFNIFNLSYYSEYPYHAANVILRDNNNQPIDGIVTNPEIIYDPEL